MRSATKLPIMDSIMDRQAKVKRTQKDNIVSLFGEDDENK
jgi:hypothetical protein